MNFLLFIFFIFDLFLKLLYNVNFQVFVYQNLIHSIVYFNYGCICSKVFWLNSEIFTVLSTILIYLQIWKSIFQIILCSLSFKLLPQTIERVLIKIFLSSMALPIFKGWAHSILIDIKASLFLVNISTSFGIIVEWWSLSTANFSDNNCC